MAEPLRCVRADQIVTGWDFSTGAVKCLAFDLDGNKLAEVRLPTDLWTGGGVSELNLMQLEGQARASVRSMARKLRDLPDLIDLQPAQILRCLDGVEKRGSAECGHGMIPVFAGRNFRSGARWLHRSGAATALVVPLDFP